MNSRLPGSLLSLCLLGTVAFAAEATDRSTVTSEPPKAYTDQGSTVTRYNDSGPTYFPSTGYGSNYGGHYGFNMPGSYPTSVRTYYRMLVAPPVPPALGEAIPTKKTQASLAKFSPPATLADFVYEPFFTPLSPLLFSEDLNRSRREKLNTYRTTRAAALVALRAKLDALQSVPAEKRSDELAAFAREQTPALAELERTAEEMRANYVEGGFFESGNNWNETRGWRLGDNTRWESNVDEIKVMLGAAFFQEGLSPAQRRLLRELAMELQDSLKLPGDEISLSSPGPYFYFSPETARIRLPADLAPELEQKIQTYQDEKAALKSELREVLYKQDRAFFAFKRVNALKALAGQQAARLARVEELAEEIRAGLVLLPNPAKPPVLPVPREVTDRVSRYMKDKAAWQRTMLARQEALRNEFPEDRVEFVRQRDSLVIQIVANRRSSPDLKAKREAAIAELAPFNAAQAKGYVALAREKEKLRTELLAIASSLAGRTGHKSIEVLLVEFAYAFGQQERWERYADYETAVLQPGLSPEQRRLLFGSALASLDLPLGNSF